MGIASVVVVSSRGLDALRATLHSVWSASVCVELAVMASWCDEDTAAYLLRQYRRGKIASLAVHAIGPQGIHCDLDRALHLTSGKYIARVSDDLELQPGWLDSAVAAIDGVPGIGCLGLVNGSGRHKPGPPRRLGLGALQTEEVDTRCFVTRRDLASLHGTRLSRDKAADACVYQCALRRLGFLIAYLPGLVTRDDHAAIRAARCHSVIDGDVPYHDVGMSHRQRVRQAYELGQDVLLTCVSCGNGELEVLSAEIEFCARHDVPVGHTYTLHCAKCGKLQFEEDLQFACRADVTASVPMA